MADLIIVCGPQAVGKMTVAESLRDKLKYNLMTNHDSIEISDQIFGFGTPAQREFSQFFREKAFELAIKHQIDLIFTYVCAFELQQERDYLTQLADLFVSNGGNFFFVELSSDIDTRIQRNDTPHRKERKPSKRNVEWSKSDLLDTAKKHRLNSHHDEIWFENHMKIDNSNLDPDTVAKLIIEEYHLIPKATKE